MRGTIATIVAGLLVSAPAHAESPQTKALRDQYEACVDAFRAEELPRAAQCWQDLLELTPDDGAMKSSALFNLCSTERAMANGASDADRPALAERTSACFMSFADQWPSHDAAPQAHFEACEFESGPSDVTACLERFLERYPDDALAGEARQLIDAAASSRAE